MQINAFSSEARSKAISTLLSIAQQCDGVRCDMAMLMTNSVFSRTWKEKAGQALEKEFWEEIIVAVKNEFPDFKFIAEVYWDMEFELMQQGFDYCYDKKLYERLANDSAQRVNEHLKADWDYQSKLLRFIENHDEPRAITVFGTEASKAAVVITSTLPGARLIFEGQTREIKLPVQLGRTATEEDDVALMEFYDNLLKIIPGREFDNGKWSLCKVKTVDSSDNSFNNIISYQWWTDKDRLLIVVNYSLISSKAHLIIEDIDFGLFNWKFTDLLTRNQYIYKGKDLRENGLYIELEGWNSHIFRVEKA
ncbi:hypothetical protein ES708_30841 [subsurface metagenome]